MSSRTPRCGLPLEGTVDRIQTTEQAVAVEWFDLETHGEPRVVAHGTPLEVDYQQMTGRRRRTRPRHQAVHDVGRQYDR